MTKKFYKKKSEVAHHGSETTGEDIAATFNRLLTLLATFGSFQAVEELFKLTDVEVAIDGGLAGRDGGHLTHA